VEMGAHIPAQPQQQPPVLLSCNLASLLGVPVV